MRSLDQLLYPDAKGHKGAADAISPPSTPGPAKADAGLLMAQWPNGGRPRGPVDFAKLRSPNDLQNSLLGRDDTLLAENISLLVGVGN